MFIVLVVLYIVMAGLTISYMYSREQKEYAAMKTITCALYLMIGFYSFMKTKDSMYLDFLPAYCLCFAGDVMLANCKGENGIIKRKPFGMGAAAFAFAQIVFGIEYLKINDWHYGIFPIIGAALLGIGTIIASRSKHFNYGKNVVICTIYGCIVGSIGGLGIQTLIHHADQGVYVILLGIAAIVFACSDTVLALKYFKVKKADWFGAFELSTYYIAMLLLSSFYLVK